MATKIMVCTCSNPFQDKAYGPGRRVHNAGMKDRKLLHWKCTVCGGKKSLSASEVVPVVVKGDK